jgi:hypothetical protein
MGALKELGFSSRGASAELNENSDNENLMCVGRQKYHDRVSACSHPVHSLAANQSFSAACIRASLYVGVGARPCFRSPLPNLTSKYTRASVSTCRRPSLTR